MGRWGVVRNLKRVTARVLKYLVMEEKVLTITGRHMRKGFKRLVTILWRFRLSAHLWPATKHTMKVHLY